MALPSLEGGDGGVVLEWFWICDSGICGFKPRRLHLLPSFS